MNHRYVLTPAALTDLLAIWEYVFSQAGSLTRADEKAATLYAAFDLLAENPALGARRAWLPSDVLAFSKAGYVIAYRERDSGIQILRVTGSQVDLHNIE